MKYLIVIDAPQAALAPIERLECAARSGMAVEVVLLNVQPRFSRHIAQFTRKADRDALRAQRSRLAMAGAAERLARAGIPFRPVAEVGNPAARIAAVAAAERVDEILASGDRRSALERYAIPVGVAGLAALLLSGE